MSCDLISRDLWISVHLNLINAKLTLFFEIRVSNQSLIDEFCREIVEIGNLYLSAIYFPIIYTTADLTMERKAISTAELFHRSHRNEHHSEGFESFAPKMGVKIEECFSFLCRTVRCHLYKRHDEEPLCESVDQQEVNLQKLEYFGAYPIRDLRVESLHTHSIAPELQAEQEVAVASDSAKCCCGIWC